jgi:hypothetical protein
VNGKLGSSRPKHVRARRAGISLTLLHINMHTLPKPYLIRRGEVDVQGAMT